MSKHNYTFSFVNKIAVPAIVAGIIEPVLSLTDTAIVGNVDHNATQALAAVGIAGSFIATLVWVFSQSRIAIAAIIAEHLGKKQLFKIKHLPAQIIAINILLGLVIYGVTYLLTIEIFKLYHAKDLILNYTVSYYRIRALGFPFLLFAISVFSIFRGLQNTFWPMVVTISGALVNIVLDVALVYGIPNVIAPMHVEGAAWASFFAQLLMFLMSLVLLLTKTPFGLSLSFKMHHELKRVLGISSNMLVRTIALNISLVLANAYATKYGEIQIAAFTIAFQIWLFFAFFIDGYASVAGIVSGKLKGEGNFKGIAEVVKVVTKYALIVSIILSALYGLFYAVMGRIFTQNEEVLTLLNSFFWVVLMMQPINAMAYVYDEVFKGLAEAKTLRNAILKATLLGFVPTLLILDAWQFGIYAVWGAFVVWMFLRFVLLRRKFVKLVTFITV